MASTSSSGSCSPLGFSDKYYFLNSNGECQRQSSFFGSDAVLNLCVGYAAILGFCAFFGAFLAVFTTFLVWLVLEKRYVGSYDTSERFNTAGRSVKTGLIASVIVSQWIWAVTILQCSNVAPLWYATCATIQVLLFGIMAIEIKRIVRARWGTAAHIVFLVFCFMNNIIVIAILLVGSNLNLNL